MRMQATGCKTITLVNPFAVLAPASENPAFSYCDTIWLTRYPTERPEQASPPWAELIRQCPKVPNVSEDLL